MKGIIHMHEHSFSRHTLLVATICDMGVLALLPEWTDGHAVQDKQMTCGERKNKRVVCAGHAYVSDMARRRDELWTVGCHLTRKNFALRACRCHLGACNTTLHYTGHHGSLHAHTYMPHDVSFLVHSGTYCVEQGVGHLVAKGAVVPLPVPDLHSRRLG